MSSANAPFLGFVLVVILIFVRGDDCDVTHYGAKGDNKTESTKAFINAIETCQGPTQGAVIVPAGQYLIRPVKLLSHTELVISPEATLVAWYGVGWENGWPNSTTRNCSASSYTAKEPIMVPRLESLLYGDALTNITIRGGGTIDGQGWRWWPLREKSEYWHRCRPHLIRIHGSPGNPYDLASKDVTFENLTLRNSPMYNFHVHAQRARFAWIHTHADGCPLNTDSFNVGGTDVYIADSLVHSGDDCVPIGKNTSDVLVERVTCMCGNGASPIIWATDNAATYIRNVTFRNMTFINTSFAANIKSLPSYAGFIDGIVFENFLLHNVRKAINIDLRGQNLAMDTKHNDHDDTMASKQKRFTRYGHNHEQWGLVRVTNITFRNFRGNAYIPGTFNCKTSLHNDAIASQCSEITMDNVNITGTHSGYSCKGEVEGVTKHCSPKPCLQRLKNKAENEIY